MKIPFFLALALHCTLGLACGYDPDSPRPLEREAGRIQSLLMADRFAELEEIDARSRKAAVISDGQPLRGVLMAAVAAQHLDCVRGQNEMRLEQLRMFRTKAKAWRGAFPASETPRLVEAMYPVREAWIVRGGAYAHKVPAEAWAGYRAHVESARNGLDALPKTVKKDPAWHVFRLEVARLQSEPREHYRRRLEESLGLHPAYLPLYFEAAQAYSPEWGGTPEDLAKFIERSATRNESSLGEVLYARLKWYGWSRGMFVDGTASWPRMKSGFERMTSTYPDAWNVNNFAKFACMAEDSATLRELIQRLQGAVVLQAWNSMTYYQHCLEVSKRAVLAK